MLRREHTHARACTHTLSTTTTTNQHSCSCLAPRRGAHRTHTGVGADTTSVKRSWAVQNQLSSISIIHRGCAMSVSVRCLFSACSVQRARLASLLLSPWNEEGCAWLPIPISISIIKKTIHGFNTVRGERVYYLLSPGVTRGPFATHRVRVRTYFLSSFFILIIKYNFFFFYVCSSLLYIRDY